MRNMLMKYKEPLSYLMFGGLTTLVHLTIYWALSQVTDSVTVCYGVAWLGAVTFAYLTNRRWVFTSQVSTLTDLVREFSQFMVARIATGVIGYLIVLGGVHLLHQDGNVWNLLSQIFVVVSNYGLSKYVIFKGEK